MIDPALRPLPQELFPLHIPPPLHQRGGPQVAPPLKTSHTAVVFLHRDVSRESVNKALSWEI